MSSVSTVTLPQNFYEVTSSQLLVQPEPQYLYAKLLLSALAAELPIPEDMGLPISGRGFGYAGADYATLDQNQLMLADPLGPEIFAATVDMTGLPGTTVRVNRPVFTDSTYTEAARRINADQTISVDPISVGSEQTMLTLRRYAGPYSGGEVRPYGIDRFSAQQGIHKLQKIVGLHLKRDFHKFLDSWVNSTLENTALVDRPVGMTDDNTPTTGGSYPLDYDTVITTSIKMDEAHLPKLPDGRRVLVVTPQGSMQLKRDTAWRDLAKFHPELNPLYSGTYIGSTPEFHAFESTTLSVVDNTSTVPIHHAHAIAPGALGTGMGEPPRVAPSTSDNYGERALSIWLGYFALELLDQRFVRSVRYSGDY
jgi:hypothetical protein